jgi:hypothetical protein
MKILSVVPRELLPEATKVSQKVLSLDAWSRSSEKSAQQLKDFLLTKPSIDTGGIHVVRV